MPFTPTYKFTFDYLRLPKPGYVTVPPNCNAIFVQNECDGLIYVNNRPVKGFPTGQPDLDGSGFGIAGHTGEILTDQQIFIAIDPAVTVFQVNITFKIYV